MGLEPDTGACSLEMPCDAGSRRPPGHSWPDLEVFERRGSVGVGGRTVGEEHQLFVPAGCALGALSSRGGRPRAPG